MSPKFQHPEGRKPWIQPHRAAELVRDVQHGHLPGIGLAFDRRRHIVETLFLLLGIASFPFLLYNVSFFQTSLTKLIYFLPREPLFGILKSFSTPHTSSGSSRTSLFYTLCSERLSALFPGWQLYEGRDRLLLRFISTTERSSALEYIYSRSYKAKF